MRPKRTRLTTPNRKHPGFETEAERIAHKEHIPRKNARAILAKSSRRASTSATRINPRLKRVPHKKTV